MLTSYSDETFVSNDYARELSNARTQPVDVEQTSDDPPDRIAVWLSSVGDSALRALDRTLLVDLLTIESDPLRWRDMADTVVAHAEDLVRVGYFEDAWLLVEAAIDEGARVPVRQPHATSALERFGRGAMMKHVATDLRSGSDRSYERFKRLCHAIGPPVIPPLAEALAVEQDARSRRRLRDILVGFGPRGRESVQQLMNAPNWEVRRTAAYLLREFGGAEGLKELIPLLADPEPLVQREAVQGLMLHGSRQAADILLDALSRATGASKDTLCNEILAVRDDRASSVLCHIVRQLDRRALPNLYLGALDALSASPTDEAVSALDAALTRRDWRTPLRNRAFRGMAAQSLRLIGTQAALAALRRTAAEGPLRRAIGRESRAGEARIVADTPIGPTSYEELVRRFASAIRVDAALRGGTPARRALRRRSARRAQTASSQAASAVVGIIDRQIVVADTPLPRVSASMGELLDRLSSNEIERISFDRGVTATEALVVRALARHGRRARVDRDRVGLVSAHPGRPHHGGGPPGWGHRERHAGDPAALREGSRLGAGRVGERAGRGHAGRFGRAPGDRRPHRRSHAEPDRTRRPDGDAQATTTTRSPTW